MDNILTILAIVVPFAGGAGLAIKQAIFYIKVVKQAVDVFEEQKESNVEIYDGIQSDPNKQELAKVLEGGVKRIKGLRF